MGTTPGIPTSELVSSTTLIPLTLLDSTYTKFLMLKSLILSIYHLLSSRSCGELATSSCIVIVGRRNEKYRKTDANREPLFGVARYAMPRILPAIVFQS